jgi:hypothetical protein
MYFLDTFLNSFNMLFKFSATLRCVELGLDELNSSNLLFRFYTNLKLCKHEF